MTKRNTSQFTKYFIYILLIGQLWSSVFSYVDFYLDDEPEKIEITTSNNDSEKESEKEEFKKEHKDKFLFSILTDVIYNTRLSANFNPIDDLLPLNHPEINTPPPKYSFYIS